MQPTTLKPADELPTVVHVTHWKAGSQWIYHILHDCCPERIVSPGQDGEHFLTDPVLPGRVYPTVNLAKQEVDKIRVPANTRFFVILRDPRDTLVSLYYSKKISHVLGPLVTREERQKLQVLNKEEGLLQLITGEAMQGVFDIHTSWVGSEVPVFHYEDIVQRDEELLVPLFTQLCPLGASESVIRSAIKKNRFEEVSGRALGVEDDLSHLRSGRPGQWKKQFNRRVADAFEKQFGDQLRRLKYVRDGAWVEEAEARTEEGSLMGVQGKEARKFSVIMSLPDHRGHAIRAVQAWTLAMAYPGEHFELIVVSDGNSPEVDARIAALLRPVDHLLVVRGANRSVLVNRGVGLAKNEQLVFSEAHVEPEPDFLKELDLWLWGHPDTQAVCCRAVSTFENHFGYWDGKLYDEAFALRRNGNEWWNINLHAFSIPSGVFHRGGGLDEEHDLFSLIVFAAKLRGLGVPIGYSGAPAVLHHYRNTLGETEGQTRSFLRDEHRFRQTHPGPDQLGFSAFSSSARKGDERRDLWPLAWARLRRGDAGLWVSLLRRDYLAEGQRLPWRKNRTAWQLAWAKLQCVLWRCSRGRVERPYRDFRRLVALDELRLLINNAPSPDSVCQHIEPGGFVVAGDLANRAEGLHGDEVHQGVHFRWTEPISMWRLGVAAEGKTITWDLLPVRGESVGAKIRIYWNDVRIAANAIRYAPGSLAVRLPSGKSSGEVSTLVVIVPRMKVGRKARKLDARSMGLAVIRVGVS